MDGGRVVSVVSAAAAAAKPAEREGERRGVLHTSSCRLKREDEVGKGGGREGETDELRIMPRGKNTVETTDGRRRL